MNRRTFLRQSSVAASLFGTLSLLSPLVRGSKGKVKKRAPALFIGHGSPENVLLENAFTRDWERVGSVISSEYQLNAVLCISAHWQSPQALVSVGGRQDLIYDFYGFPKPLYQVKYPAPGVPRGLELVNSAVADKPVLTGVTRGLDHGAWCVLSRLLPEADVPVFQLSLSRALSELDHYSLGQQIGLLRDRGVLILGSGNIVHNMRSWNYDFRRGQTHLVHGWAQEFDRLVENAVTQSDHRTLIEIANRQPHLFKMAHPTPEHYLPLLYVLGAQRKMDNVHFFSKGFEEGSFSMKSFMML